MSTQIRDFDFVRSSTTNHPHTHQEGEKQSDRSSDEKIHKNTKKDMDPHTMRRRLDELKLVSEPDAPKKAQYIFKDTKTGRKRFQNKFFLYSARTFVGIALLGIVTVSVFAFTDGSKDDGEVAGVVGEGVTSINEDGIDLSQYEVWILEKTGEILDDQTDFDNDGLSNSEEFLLQSDPANAHQCDPNKTDGQLITEAINPINCNEINWEDPMMAAVFEQLISKPQRFAEITSIEGVETVTTATSVDNISGEVDTNRGDIGSIKASIEELERQAETLDLVKRIDAYIAKSRSYEQYDRDYKVPVSSEIFIQTAEQYDVPLKYVLTIAKLESRFGTDRFDKQGNLTRPGQYQNMYSLGLDDSGNNVNYGGWDAGVLSFGKWYKRFDDRGVSDCRKWRIYNPNGDYCAKVESVASEIERSVGL